jgi:hypothetical protein
VVAAADIIGLGEQYLGTPYVWGGTDPSGFDCSGLMQYIFGKSGISIPRTTYDQIGVGTAVDSGHLQAGDLVFFSAGNGGKSPDHVAMYLGNGKMLEAPRPGEAVRIQDMGIDYYMSRFVGARRIGGVDQGPATGNFQFTGGSKTVAKLDPQELAAEYGWSYAFLNSNPDLKKVFGQAVSGNWTPDKFKAEIMTTNWWKENSDTAKQTAMTKITDPATYSANLAAMSMKIQDMAGQMGAAIPSGKLGSLAANALSANLTDEQLKYTLGSYIDFTAKGTLGGAAGAFQHVINQYAYSQGVTLSDQAVKNQAALIAKGLMTQDDALAQVRQSAISTFPQYEQQLNAGQTMSNIAAPYAQVASNLLEQPDSTFNVNHPLIRSALNKVDPNGQPTGQTLSEFEASVKQSPQWLQTNNARDSLMGIGHSVLQQMGVLQ